MAVAMVALLAFGGTFAYFTATTTDKKSDTITTGYVSLTAGDTVTLTGNTSALLPKESVTAKLSYTDSSTRGTWVVVSASADDSSLGDGASLTIATMTTTVTGITLSKYTNTSGDVIYLIENSDKATADKVVASTIDLSVDITYDATENNVDGQAATALKNMGKTFTITFSAKSIQHSGITAADALTQLGFTGYTAA